MQNIDSVNNISISNGNKDNPADHANGWIEQPILTVKQMSSFITKKVWSACIWSEGIRNKDHFKYADYAVLDFDEGRSIKDVSSQCKSQKLSYLVGTTRNHCKEKNGVICERFRLILKFKNRITNPDVYKYNLYLLTRSWESDKSCKDTSRLFFPCKEIVSFNFGDPINIYDPPKEKPNVVNDLKNGVLPLWVASFLERGTIYGRGRNNCIYACAMVLRELKFSKELAYQKISCSPFSKQDFRESEIRSAINSAFKK
jgi:hypothetical protein